MFGFVRVIAGNKRPPQRQCLDKGLKNPADAKKKRRHQAVAGKGNSWDTIK